MEGAAGNDRQPLRPKPIKIKEAIDMDKPRIEKIRAIIKYDPKTGRFRYISGPHAGFDVFRNHSQEYPRIHLLGSWIGANQLAWALHHGEWPHKTVYYRDGNTHNVRITNLTISRTEVEKARHKRRPKLVKSVLPPKSKEARLLTNNVRDKMTLEGKVVMQARQRIADIARGNKGR